jgi:hypothetical protein
MSIFVSGKRLTGVIGADASCIFMKDGTTMDSKKQLAYFQLQLPVLFGFLWSAIVCAICW